MKKDVKKTESQEAKKVDVSQLLKENEELKKQLAKVPADFEERKAYFQEKQSLIKRLNRMQSYTENLNMHREHIEEICQEEEFETSKYSLDLTEIKDRYNSENVLKLQNPVVIKDVIDFILKRMENKIAETKAKIEA